MSLGEQFCLAVKGLPLQSAHKAFIFGTMRLPMNLTLDEVRATAPTYFHAYINKVPDGDLLSLYVNQEKGVDGFFHAMPEEKLSYRYAEGKWTPKEIIGHLVDAERVFQYRSLRFARGDRQELPGFDENDYIAAHNFDDWSLGDLLANFRVVRGAGITLYRALSEAELRATGIANGQEISVMAMLAINIGHVVHHLRVIEERYL